MKVSGKPRDKGERELMGDTCTRVVIPLRPLPPKRGLELTACACVKFGKYLHSVLVLHAIYWLLRPQFAPFLL